ncbi:nitroreductase family protein [Epidermidibacterium keratini]|uniref:Nitroreductase family protein n=1 Tax=Epidermidibacterium keratini TaxID=1891644 RepID=A0A7L4YK10_9ACTN|nr:nitroreductase family protein [Epidermidibacterium keratini]QHB99138.1 nitroreductase family protein [Epidermidibacterium keratini]
MEFSEVVARRAMVRAFDPERPVSPSARDTLLDVARHAPTAGFSQGIELLVLEGESERRAFWEVTARPGPPDRWLRGMMSAPLLVVVLADETRYRMRYAEADKSGAAQDPDAWSAPFWHVDAGMAAYSMLLAAVDAGLGACFFGIPAARVGAVRDAFDVPSALAPVGVLAIGYADRQHAGSRGSSRRARRPRDEVIHMGRWRPPASPR